MRTSFTNEFLESRDGQRVNKILRSCVHCGFCNATCPTYQMTGDELDGPRGRIYIIKDFFENKDASSVSQEHLDKCLTCLACETTCPSGVEYGDLLDIGRKHIEKTIKRPLIDKLKRKLILFFFSHPKRVSFVLTLGKLFKPLLASSLANKIPIHSRAQAPKKHAALDRKMLTIQGCVQSCVAPQINSAATDVLRKAGIQLDTANSKCCGALAFHLTELKVAHQTIKTNIDDWYEKLSNDHENLLVTSSGCSSFIKQYITIMQEDDVYAKKAKLVSERCKDLTEIASQLQISTSPTNNKTIAFHSPCTLQHGLKITEKVEAQLEKAGYKIVPIKDSHICCGSAGSYSLLQGELSNKLLQNKVTNLETLQPEIIATANIGCLMHLQSGTKIPVKHWIELLI